MEERKIQPMVCALSQCKDLLIKDNYGAPDHMDYLDETDAADKLKL
jgi:hypothetical protein